MLITNIVFVLSLALFIAYTIVSLIFLNKKSVSLRDALHNLVLGQMVDENGRFVPNAEIASRLILEVDDQYTDYADETKEVTRNIISLALITTAIGVCLALTLIMM